MIVPRCFLDKIWYKHYYNNARERKRTSICCLAWKAFAGLIAQISPPQTQPSSWQAGGTYQHKRGETLTYDLQVHTYGSHVTHIHPRIAIIANWPLSALSRAGLRTYPCAPRRRTRAPISVAFGRVSSRAPSRSFERRVCRFGLFGLLSLGHNRSIGQKRVWKWPHSFV